AVCAREGLWLHVDAAYAGTAAILPELRRAIDGMERADSFVVNPHKWMFTPFDLSAFYCRRMDLLRAAFALTPEYLKTSETSEVRNLMDTGFQLGRRFRRSEERRVGTARGERDRTRLGTSATVRSPQ